MTDINIGDILYDTSIGMIERQEVVRIAQHKGGNTIYAEGCFSENEYDASAIGKDVFKSYDEAAAHCRKIYGRVMVCQLNSDFDD